MKVFCKANKMITAFFLLCLLFLYAFSALAEEETAYYDYADDLSAYIRQVAALNNGDAVQAASVMSLQAVKPQRIAVLCRTDGTGA